jgi:hypothetical protein
MSDEYGVNGAGACRPRSRSFIEQAVCCLRHFNSGQIRSTKLHCSKPPNCEFAGEQNRFDYWDFGFVSDFVLRISDFSRGRNGQRIVSAVLRQPSLDCLIPTAYRLQPAAYLPLSEMSLRHQAPSQRMRLTA